MLAKPSFVDFTIHGWFGNEISTNYLCPVLSTPNPFLTLRVHPWKQRSSLEPRHLHYAFDSSLGMKDVFIKEDNSFPFFRIIAQFLTNNLCKIQVQRTISREELLQQKASCTGNFSVFPLKGFLFLEMKYPVLRWLREPFKNFQKTHLQF